LQKILDTIKEKEKSDALEKLATGLLYPPIDYDVLQINQAINDVNY